jgi:hypothetical protein
LTGGQFKSLGYESSWSALTPISAWCDHLC